MSQITVSLSSTQHITQSDSSEILSSFHKLDIPVCAAEIGLGLFGFSERDELGVASLCLDMAKTVFIDIKKRYVFIGQDPQDTNSALIEYTEQLNNSFTESFFKRWSLTHHLILNFNCVDFKGVSVFCIQGLWAIYYWKYLDIAPGSKITVISPRESHE